MNSDLLRQRRNLLIISIILISIQIAGVKLKNGISIVGITIEFTHPERIIFGLWIIWFYFLLRYYQYFSEEKDLGIYDAMNEWIAEKMPNFDFWRGGSKHWIEWKWLFFWSIYKENTESWNLDEDLRKQESNRRVKSEYDPKSKFLKMRLSLQAFLYVSTKTPRFTDYILPFIIAIFPLMLKIFSYMGMFFNI